MTWALVTVGLSHDVRDAEHAEMFLVFAELAELRESDWSSHPLFVGELLNWREQKVTLRPAPAMSTGREWRD